MEPPRGDAHHTRYTPARNITPENFGELKEAWVWNGASLTPSGRSLQVCDGKLFTSLGRVATCREWDPETGETICVPRT